MDKQDNLQRLYDLQKHLMERYRDKQYIPGFPLDLTSKKGVKVFRDCIFHITQELFEAVLYLKNRPSRKEEIIDYDEDAFLEEMIDALHLILEAFILAGYSVEEIVTKYEEKNKVNHERLNEGY